MKKSFFLIIALILLTIGCTKENVVTNNTVLEENLQKEAANESTVEKVEVFHFHGTHQCYSCKTVGAYAEETVKTYYADEVEKGRVEFRSINGDLPENKEVTIKYGKTL